MPRAQRKKARRRDTSYDECHVAQLATGHCWGFLGLGEGFGRTTRMLPGPDRDQRRAEIYDRMREAWNSSAELQEQVYEHCANMPEPRLIPWVVEALGVEG